MRTPNSACYLCQKPLYRRPFELARVRYVACMACRAKAQSVAGVTDAQRDGLTRGRVKGHTRGAGCVHSEESKQRTAAANKAFWAANPEKAVARGAKTRGEKHVNWKGGASRLNVSIRQMTENRRWMDAVKERDGMCLRCGATDRLESHHTVGLASLLAALGVASRDDARRHAAALWDLSNGETLCIPCHDRHHGRQIRED